MIGQRLACALRFASALEIPSCSLWSSLLAPQATAARAFSSQENATAQSPKKPKWGETLISQVMQEKADSGEPTSALFFCKPDDTVFDAVKKMAAANVGSIVIMKGDPSAPHSVAGIITERDYMRKVVVTGKSSKEIYCESLMTPVNKLITLDSHKRMLDAMELMEEHNIRHIPVIDDGKLLGMLSIKDVVGTLINEHSAEVESLSEYIGGSY